MTTPTGLPAVTPPVWSRRPFLTAEWRWLLMLNYVIDPSILQPFVPRGVELDSHDGKTYASLVGFRFMNTRLIGWPIPYHTNFDEVNLRFYVKRRMPDGDRRAVVFVKEIVPRPAIAAVARLAYGERYISTEMRHKVQMVHGSADQHGEVAYAWKDRGRWARIGGRVDGTGTVPDVTSHEAFITEHYWGYARQRGNSVEYQVEHPRWRVWPATSPVFDADIAAIYGSQFVEPLSVPPVSAFVAEGSPVAVHWGATLSRK